MHLKNKIVSIGLCALVAGIGFFGIQSNKVLAQTIGPLNGTTPATGSVSIEQLQQIVNSLVAQIQQMIALIAQLKPLETCGNGICRFGETTATCPADCRTTANCANEGETRYSIGKLLDCCTGLTPVTYFEEGRGQNLSCTKCGNGTCNQGETAATCPADCGQNQGCLSEGQGHSFWAPQNRNLNCCNGLTEINTSYIVNTDGSCSQALDGGTICTKKCGNGTCDTKENQCNCQADCATTIGCREDLSNNYCEKSGGYTYAGNGWTSCSCPQKKCQNDRDCLNYPAAASYCKFENGACSGTGTCARIWSETQMGSTTWEPTLCGCNGQSYANAYELQKSGVSLKQLGGCNATKQCASEGEYANLSGPIEQRYGCCIPPKNNTYLQGFQTSKGMLCYNAANGSPVCLNQGTPKEGWYHKYTPEVPIVIESCAN